MRRVAKILLQSVMITLAGAGLGLAWNAFSPAGIPLTRAPGARAGHPDASALEDPFYNAEKRLPPRDRISVEEAHALFWEGTIKLVDARSAAEFAAMHLPAAHNIHDQHFARDVARHIDWLKVEAMPEERARFPDGYPIVVYCNNHYCDEGATTLKLLRDVGLRNVRLMARGLDGWVKKGYEVMVPVNGKLVERKGADIPKRSDTGLAWLPPGALLAALAALPWILLAGLGIAVRRGRGLLSSGLNGVSFLGRLGLGVLFLYASYFKLADPAGFARMVLCYELVPGGLVPVFTVCLPAVEALAGALLVLGLGTRPAALTLLALLAVFTAAIFVLMLRNQNCVCGCFPGKFPVSWTRVIEDLAFFFAGLLALWRGGRWLALERGPRPGTR